MGKGLEVLHAQKSEPKSAQEVENKGAGSVALAQRVWK
jgi:hypothetical protein